VRKELLIVEDDRALAEMLERLLESMGYRVHVVHDGQAAAESIEESTPDGVVLDLLLPRKDGRALLEELRASEKTRELPVVVMSGVLKGARYAREMEEAGAQAYLAKPFQGKDLVEAVESAIGPAYPPASRDRLPLRKTPFAEVLWGLFGRRLTGALHVQAGRKRKAVLLREGLPQGIRSNVIKECLGQRLFEAGRISKEALDESLRLTKAGEGRQGEILVRMGAVKDQEVKDALQRQGEDKFLEIFSWTEGDVWFEPDAESLDLSTPIQKAMLEELILRGVQRMDSDALRRGLRPLSGKLVTVRLAEAPEPVRQDGAVQAVLEALERAKGQADEVFRQHGAVLFGLYVIGTAQAAGELPCKPRQPDFEALARERESTPEARSGRVTREELESMRTQAADQNHYEVLGLSLNAPAADCKRAFFQLAKRYHPDRFAGEPDEIRALASDVFARISTAHDVLTDGAQRTAYGESLRNAGGGEESGEVARILTAEVQFQKGQALLKKKDYPRALEQFKWALELNPEEGEFRALYGWATYLENPKDEKARAEARQELEKALELAPRSVTGYYYTGQLHKACGELGPAEKMFRKVLEMDPKHVEAARELRVFRMRRETDPGQKPGLFGFGRKKG
jgi:CheY-like chemotaxis protein/tetratricopeptide (TPR) repeat protein